MCEDPWPSPRRTSFTNVSYTKLLAFSPVLVPHASWKPNLKSLNFLPFFVCRFLSWQQLFSSTQFHPERGGFMPRGINSSIWSLSSRATIPSDTAICSWIKSGIGLNCATVEVSSQENIRHHQTMISIQVEIACTLQWIPWDDLTPTSFNEWIGRGLTRESICRIRAI